ncbi:MAG: rhodanese-like domain-containing protein [Brevundimonas aurantiaca]|jgi:rhodanese-related sulfurtransferase|uniref:rhodanese-like domain-containing protein n=1 Tax=Brevundimonas TaxID=41275 RepID=UPI0006D2A38C|nr:MULTISPECIES: rhodanese-like domain-containing protein [unclassified Brevundimonas]ALJ07590.1 sulfurtransferase [Brevundimonas sp. DS20]MBB1179351.1 rhodanese-like domain-containing protein [Pseudomonas sp. FW305-3-2-15-E-TSA4]
MFGSGKSAKHREIGPAELKALLDQGEALVIDVREPGEFAAEHIAGAVNLPLSSFDPARLPAADGKTVILQCAGGKRSGMALDRCAEAQAAIDTHLAGGLGAWKSAGLPVERG